MTIIGLVMMVVVGVECVIVIAFLNRMMGVLEMLDKIVGMLSEDGGGEHDI